MTKLFEIKRLEMEILVMTEKDNWPNSLHFFYQKPSYMPQSSVKMISKNLSKTSIQSNNVLILFIQTWCLEYNHCKMDAYVGDIQNPRAKAVLTVDAAFLI